MKKVQWASMLVTSGELPSLHQGSQISTGVINTYKFYSNMYVKYPRFS